MQQNEGPRDVKTRNLKKYISKFKVLKNQYKQELMQAKRESWERFCTEHSRKSPWKIYKHCKTDFAKGPPPSTLTLIDGTPTLSIEALDLCKENGITVLTIPHTALTDFNLLMLVY